ncbi:putative ABC transport system ATP-binding protein [Sphingobacterium zeae]|uniref:ABC transport system ATP-binding protein n=1 Tax=Sphingobacterium zeae TaxID=1776859 RepID=A0ABU0UC01_9SPHI|nr:ABC transporter ATP-binding protein [Sphingobacterium zeae]MDQ1152387.1 putative ABC transport system ATP-binding protein [Sphingobacterium zeae]
MEKKKLIDLQNVSKTYAVGKNSVHALKNINWTVNSDEFIAIIGPSGSGKSSLLNLLSFVDFPSSGKIQYNGREVSDLSDTDISHFRSNKIGIIFQNFNLIPVLSALENVMFPLEIQGKAYDKGVVISKAKNLLTELGLGNYMDHKPNELSGGQKQRVAIARALITDPEIIIADEPTSALDSTTALEIIGLMKRLNVEKKITFIFSTHDTNIIKEVDYTIELKDGELKA